MKKIAAQILVMFSGALMLVLSVLPHHHHGDIIHFGVVDRCESCQDCRENARQGQWDLISHRHNHSSESDADCDLRQLFVISARDEHLLPIYHGSGADDPLGSPLFLPLVLFDRLALELCRTELLTVYCVPPSERLHSWQGKACATLRAPPFVIA